METGPKRLLDRAESYYRTATGAWENNEVDPAYENFRTAAELAAKALLQHKGIPYGRTHNIGGTLAQAGLWPKGTPGHRLSVFLASSTKAVYGFVQDIDAAQVKEGRELCMRVLEIARTAIVD